MTDCFCDTATAKSLLALDQDAAQISNVYNTDIISSFNDFDITDVAFSTLFDNIKPSEYLSPSSFPAVCNNGQLFLLHLNIRSLAKNYNDLSDFLSKFTIQPHVIALTETKIKDRLLVNISIPGYTFFHVNSNSNAGGVGAYISYSLQASEILFDTAYHGCECLWIKLTCPSTDLNYVIGTVYRHPKTNTNEFLLVNSLYLSPSTPDEVSSVIDSLNNKKAVRVHDVQTKFVKFAKTIISPRISNLFNACITEGIYPTSFKVAEIKPIYKRGDPNKATNYRPISLLSNFDKIFEKLLYNRLISYIEKFELLNEHQFGFRKNYSTTMAVSNIHDKFVKSIDQNLYSCCVFVDLSKAFDTVDHEILLKKMYHFFGIRGKTQELFRSYLSDRYQYTKVSTSISSNSRISCGVPQGSCLGPILFLMCINDIPNCSKFDISLFADDTYLMLSETNLKELESRVNEEFKNLNEWFCRNKLSVNYSKTKFMIINKIPHKSIDEPFKIALNGAVLERTESAKYLGVFIDEKLNWSVHTNHLSLQLAKLTGIFFRLRNYVSKETLYMIYHSLVYSRIQYSIIAWGCAAKKYMAKLRVRLNNIIRAITFSKSFSSMTALYKNLNILKLEDIYKLELAKFMYQINYKKVPTIFVDLFTSTTKLHHYETRRTRSSNFFLPRVNKTIAQINWPSKDLFYGNQLIQN